MMTLIPTGVMASENLKVPIPLWQAARPKLPLESDTRLLKSFKKDIGILKSCSRYGKKTLRVHVPVCAATAQSSCVKCVERL